MSYFNLKFRVDFLGHVKNVKIIINIFFYTVYLQMYISRYHMIFVNHLSISVNFRPEICCKCEAIFSSVKFRIYTRKV